MLFSSERIKSLVIAMVVCVLAGRTFAAEPMHCEVLVEGARVMVRSQTIATLKKGDVYRVREVQAKWIRLVPGPDRTKSGFVRATDVRLLPTTSGGGEAKAGLIPESFAVARLSIDWVTRTIELLRRRCLEAAGVSDLAIVAPDSLEPAARPTVKFHGTNVESRGAAAGLVACLGRLERGASGSRANPWRTARFSHRLAGRDGPDQYPVAEISKFPGRVGAEDSGQRGGCWICYRFRGNRLQSIILLSADFDGQGFITAAVGRRRVARQDWWNSYHRAVPDRRDNACAPITCASAIPTVRAHSASCWNVRGGAIHGHSPHARPAHRGPVDATVAVPDVEVLGAADAAKRVTAAGLVPSYVDGISFATLTTPPAPETLVTCQGVPAGERLLAGRR